MAVEICALRLKLALPHWAAAPAFVPVCRIYHMAAIVEVWEAIVACHLYPQYMAIQHDLIEGTNGILSMAPVEETNKSKASRFFSKAVSWDIHIANLPVLLEDNPQAVGCSTGAQVVHLNRGHAEHIERRAPVTHGL